VAAAAFERVAHRARGEGRADDAEISEQERVAPLRQRQALGRVLGPEIVQRGGGRGGVDRELPRHGDESQPRKYRDEQREGEQHVAQFAIERPAVEQEMQPEAAVHPARRHNAELRALRVREPEIGHHPRVVRRHPEQLPR
jgi:hypothetical protein